MSSFIEKFKRGFYWNLSGTLVYELTKTVNNYFLIRFIAPTEYGIVGSVLSIIYLAVKIADVGTTHSLPPFFHLIQESKAQFLKIFWRYFLLPQFPAIILSAIVVTLYCKGKFLVGAASWAIGLLPLLIFLETLRSFFRYFLHFSFKSHYVVSFEVGSYFCYNGFIWLGILFYPQLRALETILAVHALDSLFIVIVFSALIYRNYSFLSNDKGLANLAGIKKRILKMRIFNYLLRLSRECFTNSFLTPLFAIKFGLRQIGLFYFAGAIATSIQSVIKAVVGYSGTALLANIKNRSRKEKVQAFEMLCRKNSAIMMPMIIFLFSHMHLVVRLGSQHTPALFIIAVLLLFCLILSMEFFFMLYEQFYVMEEAARSLFMIKIFEFILLYLVIGAFPGTQQSLLHTFSGIVLVRLISFVLVGINAYYKWGIRPRLVTNAQLIIIYLVFSLAFAGMLEYALL